MWYSRNPVLNSGRSKTLSLTRQGFCLGWHGQICSSIFRPISLSCNEPHWHLDVLKILWLRFPMFSKLLMNSIRFWNQNPTCQFVPYLNYHRWRCSGSKTYVIRRQTGEFYLVFWPEIRVHQIVVSGIEVHQAPRWNVPVQAVYFVIVLEVEIERYGKSIDTQSYV